MKRAPTLRHRRPFKSAGFNPARPYHSDVRPEAACGALKPALAALGALLLAGHVCAAGSVLRVDDDAPAGGDGASWETAHRFLADALLAAEAGGVSEIRVAQGTYLPDHDEEHPDGSGDREATFDLITGVAVRGGFAGLGAGDPDERDIERFRSILTGDLLGDDGPEFTNTLDNSEHVVRAGSLVEATAVLDGVTIMAGRAPRFGGGMTSTGQPTIRRCTFTGNLSMRDGGGVSDRASTFLDCTFTGNAAVERGGGVFTRGVSALGDTTLDGCTLSGNSARWGGGVAIDRRADVVVADCLFTDNTAEADGGGMYVNDDSDPAVSGCTFEANRAGGVGGGLYVILASFPTVTDCTFRGNSADGKGGGMAIRSESDAQVTACSFVDNESPDGGGMYVEGSDPLVTGCTFEANRAGRGGGISLTVDSLAVIRGCTFLGNEASTFGGGLTNFRSSPTITECLFLGNTAAAFGGGLYGTSGSSPAVTNCLFSGNTAGDSGGAMRNHAESNPNVANCTFSANAAPFGGAVSNVVESGPVLSNCVLWNNGAGPIDGTDVITVRFSNVEGGFAGEGNIDAEPAFVDADGPDDVAGTADDDLRLTAGSPVIDAGDNAAVPEGTPRDLDGRPRFRDDLDTPDTGRGKPPIVDMGAYEFQGCAADFDGTGEVDFADVVAVLAAWGPCSRCPEDLNGDEVVDFADLLLVLTAWGPCP